MEFIVDGQEGTTRRGDRPTGAAPVQFLTFALAGECYGISIDSIVEILKYRPATTVPRASSVVHGIVSVRGRIITVLDGRQRLGFDPGTVNAGTRIIVVHDRGEQVGLLVDEVFEVVKLAVEDIAPPPPTVADALDKGIRGVCDTRDGSLLIILETERFLAI